MKLGIWGAGNIGTGIALRAMTSPFVSEIHWINRSQSALRRRVIDLEHGLAFAPSCRTVSAHAPERADDVLRDMDLVVLTAGAGVPRGGSRNSLYPANRDILRRSVLPSIRGISGLVLAVSNPVDLLTRLVHREAGIPSRRVFGLGTVVETARLRRSLSSYFPRPRPAREVTSYAVGTHDEHFVPVMRDGDELGPVAGRQLEDVVRAEVVRGASRVKTDGISTLHPIVEGAMTVIESAACDSGATLTISVLDPEDPDGLFYSVPCSVGRDGADPDHHGPWRTKEVEEGLDQCRRELRARARVRGRGIARPSPGPIRCLLPSDFHESRRGGLPHGGFANLRVRSRCRR